MKYILIIFISIFTFNYSFSQMKVYSGKDVYNKNNLVGIIYESGKVYSYSNGQLELFGKVELENFYIYGKDKSKIYTGYFSNIRKGGSGKINIGEEFETSMMGFYNYGKIFVGKDIEDKSSMIGFHDGDFINGMDGNYVAAFMLIFNYLYSK